MQDFLSQTTTFNSNSIRIGGERNNILSSTMIEDVPQRTNNQLNRYTPQENGQHSTTTPLTFQSNSQQDNHGAPNQFSSLGRSHHGSELNLGSNQSAYCLEGDHDEGSSSQSREKANPFAITNDSTAVNFSAHLQRAKSLFSNRSYVSPRLRNYRMRNPRSSMYRSTSSLCDNNSVSSNTSSVMSSPFYNGQTAFGGASSTSKRFGSTFQPDMQLQQQFRPKIPTNLVTKSTSSLNTTNGGMPSMSSTAKHILQLMSNYKTPLKEIRSVSNALPTINESSTSNKRRSILDNDTSTEWDKSKRSLIKPNTPYNRPFGRNPIPTSELQVPSMSELLQLKKSSLRKSTIQIREIANKSDSVLNQTDANEFKLDKNVSSVDRDLDATNNNTNKKNDIFGSNAASKQHKNKIRCNISNRKLGKKDDIDLPEPVNLPNITLNIDKNAEIRFSEPFKLQSNDQKAPNVANNGLQIPFSFKSSNTNNRESPAPISKDKITVNGNGTTKNVGSVAVPSFSFQSTTNTTSIGGANTTNFSFTGNQKAVNKISSSPQKNSTFKFTDPIYIAWSTNATSAKSHTTFGDKSNFKFSEPIYVGPDAKQPKLDSVKGFADFKFGHTSSKNASIDSGVGSAKSHSFGATVTDSKSSEIGSSKSTFSSGKNMAIDAAKTLSTAPTQLNSDDTFKSLIAKQKQGKWECSSCMVSNDATASKCVCCGAENTTKSATSHGAAKVDIASSKPVVDDVFKSLIAKQKQGKWECSSCMSQNDTSELKCACCGESQPNSSGASQKAANVPASSTFSFGSLPAPVAAITSDSVFKSIAAKQKSSTWECSACLTKNDMSKSKCMCCDQSNNNSISAGSNSSTNLLSKPSATFSFGTLAKSSASDAPTSASAKFSFGSKSTAAATNPTTSATFSFGSKVTSSTETTSTATFSFGSAPTKTNLGQFSFGSSKTDSTTSKTVSEPAKADTKESTNTSIASLPATNKITFGSPLNTSVLSTTATKIDTSSTPNVATDDIFKKIVSEQSAKWECKSCMTKNDTAVEKCVCCEASKDGSATSNEKKGFELKSKSSFSFGSPSQSTFSFGSKPTSTETSTQQTTFGSTPAFGSNAFAKPASATFQFGSGSGKLF